MVLRINPSSGPTSGTFFSSRTSRPGSAKIAAFIFSALTVMLHVFLIFRMTQSGRSSFRMYTEGPGG